MANSSTLIQSFPCAFGSGGFVNVYQYKVIFDTLTSNLTIHTPSAATKRCALVGCLYQEADAHSISWKTDTTTLVTLQQPVFGGQSQSLGLGNGVSIITKAGEALIAENLTATVATMLVYVAEVGKEGLLFQST